MFYKEVISHIIMLVIKGLTKNYVSNLVFDEANLVVNKSEKLALIGSNGAGKTTLLRIILDFDDDFYGNIDNTFKTTAYMTQDLDLNFDHTLFDEAVFFDNRIVDTKNKLLEIESKLSQDDIAEDMDAYQKLLDEYERKNQEFIDLGGHKLEEKGKNVLLGLGFSESQFDQEVETLSGGEKTKLKLAKALICESDLLILDEPTNHLDIENIVWLEGFLKQYKGSVVMISHDKYLLNKVCTHTCLVINGKIQKYKGNYDSFYQKLMSQSSASDKIKKKIDNEIKRANKIIKEYKSCFGNLKKKMKNNLYRLHKKMHEHKSTALDLSSQNVHMKFKSQNFIPREFDYERFGENPIAEGGEEIDKDNWRFLDQNQKYIKPLFEVSDLTVKYGDRTILDNLSIRMIPGEVIAVVGENGKGKTTMMNAIYHLFKHNRGSTKYDEQIEFYNSFSPVVDRFHDDIELVYFDQEYKKLNPRNSVMEELNVNYYSNEYEDMRKVLSKLLFNEQQLKQRVSTLSGGEKAKLNFAEIMLANYNFMILDEPTNHLDINTKEILADALINYNGSVLFVSHDREFVSKVADKVYALKNGKLWPMNKNKLFE